jgi:hypothetical protein
MLDGKSEAIEAVMTVAAVCLAERMVLMEAGGR